MDISDVISYANATRTALRSGSTLTTEPGILRKGRREDVDHFLNPNPTHTDYLWVDDTGTLGISSVLPIEAEVIATVEDTTLIGTSKPLPVETDPNVRVPHDLIPYDPVTAARMILALWFEVPSQPPLYSRKTFDSTIWKAEHGGAFDLSFTQYGPDGVSGRTNINILDDLNRNTALRLLSEMMEGHFLPKEEAEVLIDDLGPIGAPEAA